jgi:hypothetical protein
MNSAFMLLKIRSVLLNPSPYWKNALWINELNRQLENIGKMDNHIIIPVGTSDNPTYLVFRTVSNSSYDKALLSCFSNSTGSSFDASSQMMGCYNWRSGYGFSLSISKANGMSDKLSENREFSPDILLLGKYLEFLEKFNRSYDDDLFLDLLFYVKEI